jgi:hypothetical protein
MPCLSVFERGSKTARMRLSRCCWRRPAMVSRIAVG